MSRKPPSALLLTTISPFILAAIADTSAPSSLPQVDFSRMGSVGLGGSFSGLDWFSPSASSSSTPSRSSDGDSVFVRSSDGSSQLLGSTNAGGKVSALCWSNSTISSTDSTAHGTLFIGGAFTSVSSTSSPNIIAYSLTSSTFHALSSGLGGPVNTLHCDNALGEVWVGGSFSPPAGSGGNVAIWSTSSSAWSPVEFGGLNGPVETIAPSPNGSNLYFGGHFTTSFVSNSSSLLNATSSSNSTLGNITSVPSAPPNTSTTGNSGYLTPVTLPSSSSASGNITVTAGPSTSQSQYSDPNVLLCPGKGVWLAQDKTISNVDVMSYNRVRATGARVANGLVKGRGATSFCFTSLPDDTQLNMTYTDPATGKNATCWDQCPLSTDPTIAAQDFIFTDGPRNLTGLQMQLKAWIGKGAGLSSVQLLSEGAYTSAVTAGNQGVCSAANTSSVQQSGEWTTGTVDTTIPATTAYYITSKVPTSNPTYPSVTFYPYVSSAGYYDIYIIIPGCSSIGDCAGRSSVDIEVFPVPGGLGWTSTISEQVQEDTKTLVYSGPVDASTGSFTPTVALALAKSPLSVASGKIYISVAEAVELVLTGVTRDGSSSKSSRISGTAGVNGTTTMNPTQITKSSAQVAFGVFEWSTSSTSTINAATSDLSNSTETALSRIGFALDAAYNTSSLPPAWTVNAVAIYGSAIFAAGDFSAPGNYSNIISVDASGQAVPLASQGLNGVVHSAAIIENYLFFGGEFTSTAASGGVALNYLARYDPKGNAWAAVGGGVDGAVFDLIPSSSSTSQLIVVGNFSHVVGTDGSSTQTGGYAIWDTSKSAWSTPEAVYGNVSAVAVPSSSSAVNAHMFLAGRVFGVTSNPASGVAMLSTSSDGSATITSLSNVAFGSAGSAPAPSSSARRRSLHARQGSYTHNWLSRFTSAIVQRKSPILYPRATTAPTIATLPAPAPAVLTGGFWTNSSASGKPTVTILGGNFTSGSGSSEVQGVAFYSSSLTGPDPPVQGVVRALQVIGNDVYIGGTGVNVSGVGSGVVVYHLATSSWSTGGIPLLNPAAGANLTVNAIKARSNTDTVVVVGNFATAGSLACAAVCLWDTSKGQWSTPGPGLLSGQVRAVDFADDSYDVLVVAGSFVLSDGSVAYAASYSFTNSTWTALGTLPGPALAITVDDKNGSNVFAAGYATSDASPYLQQWNGQAWTAQNQSLLSGSVVQQLAFVPMSTEHTAVGSIENDRMLMVSGDLYLESSGNVTSALYDGAQWYPYLMASSGNGGLGSASQLFWSSSSFSFHVRHLLARGLVVLVAIAIATGLILLLILIAFIIAYLTRRSERRNPHMSKFEREGSEISSTHQHVFNNVQAALEQSLIGGSATTAIAAARESAPSNYGTAEGAAGSDEEGEDGRESTMRYDFEGPELQPGELSMRAGHRVVVLDDVQSDEWWYARDPVTGREGVIPATYVW